ncbi:MAG TPA: sensor histidine kinase [Gemmatimonadaceae bacterium]|nr:sensor histidine kinase [Gemmatimonadaceae bacterium]
MPRLSQFIREHREEILAAWQNFARERPGAASMDVAALRDHAGAMLDTVAHDLETPQTEEQRAEKAHGAQKYAGDAETTAASQHGLGRAESGFSVESMIAEFRALRASVISLWRERQIRAGPDELEELTRFNEAIDQAITESVARYTREVESTRDRFFAVLGHDLKTPLSAIITSTQFLLESTQLTEAQRRLIAGMERSGHRMTELVRDILDLALTRLGTGIPLKCTEIDMGVLIREVVAEAAASWPGSRLEVETSGPLGGLWDRARLAEALGNLIGNALQHGSPNAPIRLTARGNGSSMVTVSVTNEGPPIPPEQLGGLFKPMKGSTKDRDRRHLGLGLYIVDKIVDAHGGSIDVRSSEAEGTTFAVSLPRRSCAGRSWEQRKPGRKQTPRSPKNRQVPNGAKSHSAPSSEGR